MHVSVSRTAGTNRPVLCAVYLYARVLDFPSWCADKVTLVSATGIGHQCQQVQRLYEGEINLLFAVLLPLKLTA